MFEVGEVVLTPRGRGEVVFAEDLVTVIDEVVG